MDTSLDHMAIWFILLLTVHAGAQQTVLADDFARADSLYHGDGWETINPGCWKIENHAAPPAAKSGRMGLP